MPKLTKRLVEAAEARLAQFERRWDERSPSIRQSRRRNGEKVAPFFAFHEDIRRIIDTSNAIESLPMTIRKTIKTRGSFSNDVVAPVSTGHADVVTGLS